MNNFDATPKGWRFFLGNLCGSMVVRFPFRARYVLGEATATALDEHRQGVCKAQSAQYPGGSGYEWELQP